MSDKRLTTEFKMVLREKRAHQADAHLRELVRFLARRAAEEDYENLRTRQHSRKLHETCEQVED